MAGDDLTEPIDHTSDEDPTGGNAIVQTGGGRPIVDNEPSGPIDRYLTSLALRLRHRADVDDVVDELRDHLRSAADAAERDGADRENAERAAVDRCGDPAKVAIAYATSGPMPHPTSFTRSAGPLALAAAGGWVLFTVLMGANFALDNGSDDWGLPEMLRWFAAVGAALGAGALSTVVLMALRERHDGLGLPGTIGVGLAVAATGALLFAWLYPVWGSLFALATLWFGGAMLRQGLAPIWAAVLLAGAWPLAMSAWALVRFLELGTPDEWGDYWAATVTLVTIGPILFAAGLIGIGRWLGAEEPIVIPRPAAMPTPST